MTKEKIILKSFNYLMPYVNDQMLENYKNEFFQKGRLYSKFAISFFSKYIDFENHIKNPKKPYDILILNYWYIEVPVLGIRNTEIFKQYEKESNKIINQRIIEGNKS